MDGTSFLDVDTLEEVALPLFEGRMINHFDFSEKGWVSGKGRKAVWRSIGWEEKRLEPQFLIAAETAVGCGVGQGWKVVFMDICSSTNTRTFYGTVDSWAACGHSAPTLRVAGSVLSDTLQLTSLLNSFPSDFLFRSRIGGQHLTWNYLEETSLPRRRGDPVLGEAIAELSTRLCFAHLRFATGWLVIAKSHLRLRTQSWKRWWAVTRHERLRLRAMLEALVARRYGLDEVEFAWILRDCAYASSLVNDKAFSRRFDPKGFWRVDRDDDPELRLPVVSQIAFQDLMVKGLDEFLAQNGGEGWMIPETLRLADYGLGHGDRAKEYQPVASRLGPRFLDWQLEQSVPESWEECERHADLIGRILPLPAEPEPHQDADAPPTDLFGNPIETDLFGNPVAPKRRGGGPR